jgi:hypothetical protein
MNEPEGQFDDLQALLRCKRYEEPPPGYFLSFSNKVIARLEAEEAVSYSSWWDWITARFDAKPVLVCAFGLAVSSLLFMGFRLSQIFEAEMAMMPTGVNPWPAATPASPVTISPDFVTHTYADNVSPVGFAGPKTTFLDDLSPHSMFLRSGSPLQAVSFRFGEP